MGAANIFTVAMGVSQYQQQGAIGKYNQAANERTGSIKERLASSALMNGKQ